MAFRTSRSGTVNGATSVTIECEMFKRNIETFDCLAGYAGDNGKHVPGCTIMLFLEAGQVKLCVKDKHYKRIGFAVLNTGLKLSQAIEEVLDQDGLDWRPDRG